MRKAPGDETHCNTHRRLLRWQLPFVLVVFGLMDERPIDRVANQRLLVVIRLLFTFWTHLGHRLLSCSETRANSRRVDHGSTIIERHSLACFSAAGRFTNPEELRKGDCK